MPVRSRLVGANVCQFGDSDGGECDNDVGGDRAERNSPDMSVISTWTAFKVSLSLDLSDSSVIDGLAMFAFLDSSTPGKRSAAGWSKLSRQKGELDPAEYRWRPWG